MVLIALAGLCGCRREMKAARAGVPVRIGPRTPSGDMSPDAMQKDSSRGRPPRSRWFTVRRPRIAADASSVATGSSLLGGQVLCIPEPGCRGA